VISVKLFASSQKGARSIGWCPVSSASQDRFLRKRRNWSRVRAPIGSSWCRISLWRTVDHQDSRAGAAFQARYPWIKTELAPHLGSDARLFTLMDERLDEAMEGKRPLPCDTCQYRVPVSAVTENVGGLKALLWSLRHGFTHAQAMPHVHAHRPLAKHVLVCGNVDCADAGSITLIATLRRLLKETGREQDIRVELGPPAWGAVERVRQSPCIQTASGTGGERNGCQRAGRGAPARRSTRQSFGRQHHAVMEDS